MTVPLTETELKSYREGLFFVVGNSRSGTTLLQAMLTSHSRLTIPPESHYFAELPLLKAQFGTALSPEATEELVRFSLDPLGRFPHYDLDRETVLQTFRQTAGTYEDFFVVCLALYASARDKARCGEKTPRHLMHVEQLAETFPGAKFIALFRDPRAVVSSELQTEFGNPSAYVIARRWRRFVEHHQRLAAKMPADRYTMVRYEDLVSQPREQLENICELLGEDFEESMLNFQQRSRDEQGFPGRETWKDKTFEPLARDRIQAWRLHLSKAQIQIIERAVGPRLAELGYDRADNASVNPVWLYLYWGLDFSKSIAATLVRKLRRRRQRREYRRSLR